jgi:opacity protein-like surface antigen
MEKGRMKRLLVLVVGLAVSGLAWSESWVGLNYAALEQDNRFYRAQSERLETDEVFLRLGADMNDYFASELRVGTTPEATEEFGYSFEHDYILTALVRARYEMGAFSPYLALGPSRVEDSVTSPTGGTGSSSADGVALGVGLDIELGDHFGINAEFMRYYDIGNVTLRGPSAGVSWRF